MHQVCTRCAPGVHYLGVHHVITVHQVCTRCAPGVHWGVHQVCTRCSELHYQIAALFLEVLVSPSGIVRRRISHYGRNLWKSGNLLIKGFLISCFTTVYSVTTVLALAHILKSVLTYCETFSLPFLLRGAQWLTELLQVGLNLEAIAVFLAIWLSTYFIVKEYFYHPMLVIPIGKSFVLNGACSIRF